MKILIAILLGSLALGAQDRIPKRIVGITAYPSEAKRQRLSGKVEIRCFVTPDGSVAKTEIVSGHPVFFGTCSPKCLSMVVRTKSSGEGYRWG
jgi:hypothetical protein